VTPWAGRQDGPDACAHRASLRGYVASPGPPWERDGIKAGAGPETEKVSQRLNHAAVGWY
jgi:hypothetical protein